MIRTTRLTSSLLVGAVLVLAACNDDGRNLADASSTSQPTVPETEDAVDPALTDALDLTLTSPAFEQGGQIDPVYTCNGDNQIPALTFSGVPQAAVELAVTVVDEDADGYVHWVVAGLPASMTALGPDSIPEEAVFGTTDSGVAGWAGPCPPPGDDPHAYVFTLHAFAEPLGLQHGVEGRQAVDVISQTAIDSATLTAFYAAG